MHSTQNDYLQVYERARVYASIGAFGGWWQADPKEGSVLIFLTHNMVDLAQMAKGIGLGVWGAIDTFQTLASASRPAS